MPTEFASAIADLRLSPEKLTQDAAAAHRQLLRITQQLEAQARIALRVTIDVRQAQRDLNREVTRLSQAGALNIPVGLDADRALDEIIALQSIVDPIAVPVSAVTDNAAAEIQALQNRVDPVVVPFDVDTDEAVASMDRVVEQALPPTVDAFAAAGERSGRAFNDRLTAITTGAVGSLSLALGAYVGTALVTGFARLTTIEDATSSLTVALQSATDAAQVLDDVLGVVTGTPYNLDQFARAASNLISFGVEAEKIPLYLTAIGEAAANRGSRANEFAQRLADTFGQISIQGRILGEDLLSLQATGVDALRILGNSFNVTTSEVQELLREGVIPVDQALDALSQGILNGTTGINGATVAFAGTMEGLRETLTGTIGGFRSATARLGVAIIDPFQELLISGFGSATDIVNQFTASIGESLSGIAESEGLQNFIDLVDELPDKIDPLLETLSGMGPALAPLAAAFGAQGLGQLANLFAPLQGIARVLNPLALAIAAFVATTPELRDELLPVLADLGEAIAILGIGVGDALGKGLEELTPLLGDIIETVGDFTPLARDVAVVGVAFAQGLVPVLGTLADILDGFPIEVLTAIGVGFLAFKAIDKLRSPLDGVVRRLDGVSERLIRAQGDADQFGNRWTAAAGRVGVSAETVARANNLLTTSLNVASVAAVGFFSGMALASDDATTQITGFVGAATGVVAAFAAGGPVGGLVATAAVVGGALVGMWQDSQQAAEEYRELIGEVSESVIEDLGEATAALLSAQDLLGRTELRDTAIDLVGEDEIVRLRSYGIELADLIEAAKDPEFAARADELIANIEAAAEADAQAAVERGEDYGIAYADSYRQGILEGFDNFGGLNLDALIELEEILPGQFNTNIQGISDVIDLVDKLGDIAQDTAADIDKELTVAISAFEAAFADALRGDGPNRLLGITEAAFGRNVEGITARVEELGLKYDDVIKLVEKNAEDIPILLDNAFRFTSEGINPLDPIILSLDELEEKYGKTFNILDDGTVQILETNEDVAESYEDMAAGAEEFASAAEIALERADRATKRLDESLDSMLDTLNEITQAQDFAAGFRDIGAALDEIVNLDALKDAERLIDDIANQRDDIADLERKIAEEQGEANILAADLDRRIAEASAAGSVTGLATLKAQRDAVFIGVNNLQSELAQSRGELGALQSEYDEVAQAPQTLGDLLEQQAREHGLSLFEFLIAAPTDEAQDFFQSQLAPQIELAADMIQQAVDESPLLAGVEIPNILDQLATGWLQQGVDPALVDQLVGMVRTDTAGIAAQAVDAFEEGFNASLAQLGGFTEQIIANEQIDPSVDVQAVVSDVEGDLAELEALEAEGLEIPGDIDLDEARATLEAFQAAMLADEDGFSIVIPFEGDMSQIIADLEALAAYALTLTGGGPGFVFGAPGVSQFADGGIVEFYRNGGITENHIAQLHRHGTIRVWNEPETDGEAYIPMGMSKRSRSERILGEVASEFGMALTRLPVGAGLSSADIEDAVYRGSAKGMSQLELAARDYEGSVIQHNYFPDGTSKSKETARDIRRRLVKARRR